MALSEKSPGVQNMSEMVVGLVPIGSTPDAITTDVDSDQASIFFKQTRTRRLFSGSQLFGYMIVYMATWSTVAGNIFFALQNGGPAAWLFGFLIVTFGAMCQTASFAELASIQPVAGAQYYWTYHLAPPRLKLFLTWVQGWATWFGYVAMLAGVANSVVLTLEGTIILGVPEWVPLGWQTMLILLAYLVFITVINMYCFWLVPWFELICGVLNLTLFLVVLVVLWVMAPRNSIDIFLVKTTGAESGWENYPVSFNIGCLSAIFLYVGFEGAIHMGEETRNPRQAVPRAVFWGMVTNACLGFIMILTFGMAMPPTEELLSSVSPVVDILQHATKSKTATIAVMSALLVTLTAGLLGTLSSVSRLGWAWARDGGLPKYFSIVDERTRVPLRAVFGTSLLIVVLAMLNLNGEAYIAFGAIISLSSLALYLSYAIVLACVIYARFATNGGIQFGAWNWGRAGLPFNIAALVYTVYEIIWLPFPNRLPVTPANMNYSGPVFAAVILGAVSWWFLWARKNWKGPNRAIVEIVLRNDDASK